MAHPLVSLVREPTVILVILADGQIDGRILEFAGLVGGPVWEIDRRARIEPGTQCYKNVFFFVVADEKAGGLVRGNFIQPSLMFTSETRCLP